MNLYRWVKGLGLTPRVMGNIKGLQDPYRNPTTQKGFAEKWGQNPAMVTSFADGSKISFEQAIVANATGFVVKSRGMSRGAEYKDDVMKIGKLYDIDELRRLGGIVDYVVGTPLTKVYCLAEHPDPKQQHYLNLYKMGDGPLYSFFIPYHLVHFEVHNAIARVVLFRDSIAKPLAGPVVEVCAVAKRDQAGENVQHELEEIIAKAVSDFARTEGVSQSEAIRALAARLENMSTTATGVACNVFRTAREILETQISP